MLQKDGVAIEIVSRTAIIIGNRSNQYLSVIGCCKSTSEAPGELNAIIYIYYIFI